MAIWCNINDAKEHLGDAENAKGYTGGDVAEKIEGAEDYLRPYFAAAVSSTLVAGWVSKATTPKSVIRLTAMLAAVYILQSYGGQSVEDELTKAGSLWAQIKAAVKGVQDGSYLLVDTAGSSVGAQLPNSTTLNKTPAFSMGNLGDNSEGSLDNF